MRFSQLTASFVIAASVLFYADIIKLPSAEAQSIQITSPSVNVTVAEADDYASIALLNPWDFEQRRDIGWEENYSGTSINASGGIWTGTNSAAGPYVFPLFGGFKTGLFAEAPGYDPNNPRFGINHPIDTNRFSVLSYKLNQQNRSTFSINWNNNPAASYFPDGSQMGASIDGFYQGGRFFQNNGWQIYSFNMRSLPLAFEQFRGSWSGNAISLRIDTSIGAPPGSVTQFDWIRLTDPATGTVVPINWSSSGLSSGRLITIYADNNASGFDGTPIARFSDGSDPRSFGFNTAVLPPGSYWFYITASSGQNLSVEATSGYSARVTINQAPAAAVRSPSETSGIDYATAVRGDPWDMNNSSDVANLPGSVWPQLWRQFTAGTFSLGLFQALADPPLTQNGNLQSDAQVHLSLAANQPIDPRRFRYLTYKLGIDQTLYPSISDKIRDGWIARPIFWTGGLFFNGPAMKGSVVYEGIKNYSVDLWGSNAGNGLVDRGNGWSSLLSIPYLRIDPLETTLPTWFYLDEVVLTEENRSQNGSFNVRLDLVDSDSGSVAVKVFYDLDFYGFNGTEITSAALAAPGSHTLTINTGGWVRGRKYWLYLELNDGINIRRQYIPYPVVADKYYPAQGRFRAHLDFDGDMRSDTAVYRAPASTYFGGGSSGRIDNVRIGGATSVPVEGDFDGDLVSDYSVLFPFRGSVVWLTRSSLTGQVVQRLWGVPGDAPAVADYNGDMHDDIAVFRSGTWYVLYDNGAVEVKNWGQAGDVAVPGDYDGDNHADIAIWRPADGTWWILYSGFAFGWAKDYYGAIQWGLPGDIALPFDYDGDGRTDLVVWRPSNGTWYIRSTVSGEAAAIQWGLPGDIPTFGDFDGDHFNDMAVFRPATGTWYIRYRSGLASAKQWGLPGDKVAFR